MDRQTREADRGGGCSSRKAARALAATRWPPAAGARAMPILEGLAQAGVGEALRGVGGLAAEIHGVVGVIRGGLPVVLPCIRVRDSRSVKSGQKSLPARGFLPGSHVGPLSPCPASVGPARWHVEDPQAVLAGVLVLAGQGLNRDASQMRHCREASVPPVLSRGGARNEWRWAAESAPALLPARSA